MRAQTRSGLPGGQGGSGPEHGTHRAHLSQEDREPLVKDSYLMINTVEKSQHPEESARITS